MSIDGEVVGHDAADLVGAGGVRAAQDVVVVGGDHQPVDRQAHAFGRVAGEDVAEVAGRHREGDGAVRAAERRRGDEVVGDLRHHACPVDGVDAGQLHAIAESEVVEHRLQQRLAIVERAVDGNRVHVGFRGGRHHAPLHVGDTRPFGNRMMASTRLEPRNASIAAPPVSPDVAPTTVTRALRAASTRSMRRATTCMATSLKASVGPWKSSRIHEFGPVCTSGVTAGWPKRAIGVARDGQQFGARDGAAGKQVQDRRRHVGERLAGKGGDGLGLEPRPGFRHVEPAVACQPGQQGVLKAEFRGFASGADVAQGMGAFVAVGAMGWRPKAQVF